MRRTTSNSALRRSSYFSGSLSSARPAPSLRSFCIKPARASDSRKSPSLRPSGTRACGNMGLPNFISTLHARAIARVLLKASGRSANSSAISRGVLKYCCEVWRLLRLGSFKVSPQWMHTRASWAMNSPLSRNRTSLLATRGMPLLLASSTVRRAKSVSPGRPTLHTSRNRRSPIRLRSAITSSRSRRAWGPSPERLFKAIKPIRPSSVSAFSHCRRNTGASRGFISRYMRESKCRRFR